MRHLIGYRARRPLFETSQTQVATERMFHARLRASAAFHVNARWFTSFNFNEPIPSAVRADSACARFTSHTITRHHTHGTNKLLKNAL